MAEEEASLPSTSYFKQNFYIFKLNIFFAVDTKSINIWDKKLMIYLCQKNIAFEKIEKKKNRHLNVQYQELKCHFYLAFIALN